MEGWEAPAGFCPTEGRDRLSLPIAWQLRRGLYGVIAWANAWFTRVDAAVTIPKSTVS